MIHFCRSINQLFGWRGFFLIWSKKNLLVFSPCEQVCREIWMFTDKQSSAAKLIYLQALIEAEYCSACSGWLSCAGQLPGGMMLNCAKINGLQTQKKERALEYLNVPWTTTSQNFPLCLFVWAESDGVSCSVKALQIVSVSARRCTDGPNKYQSCRKSDGTAAEGARRLSNEVSSKLINKHVEHRRMLMFMLVI